MVRKTEIELLLKKELSKEWLLEELKQKAWDNMQRQGLSEELLQKRWNQWNEEFDHSNIIERAVDEYVEYLQKVLHDKWIEKRPWKPPEKLKTEVPSAYIKTSLMARILPEEYRADLNNLRHRWIVKQKLPKWLVNIRTYLFLLVVFKGWLQIKFESLFLPNNRSS